MERLTTTPPPKRIAAAIFDFDGTLSLLRRDWQSVMVPLMVDILSATPTSETRAELTLLVEDFVIRLTGKQTIFQMIRLAQEVSDRGVVPKDPLAYKHQYLDELWKDVGSRVEAVRAGITPVEDMVVAGSHACLDALSQRNVTLYLASGTDLPFVNDEAQVLGLSAYFGPHIYGALDDYENFSKAMIIEGIIDDLGGGESLLGIGDGYVEIEEVKKVGGFAIGVASHEDGQSGMNTWKRERLAEAGADLIVADFREIEQLVGFLFGAKAS